MNFFDHKDLGNHLLQLWPKVVKHPVYTYNEQVSRRFQKKFKVQEWVLELKGVRSLKSLLQCWLWWFEGLCCYLARFPRYCTFICICSSQMVTYAWRSIVRCCCSWNCYPWRIYNTVHTQKIAFLSTVTRSDVSGVRLRLQTLKVSRIKH
jgi:hypothetical protein